MNLKKLAHAVGEILRIPADSAEGEAAQPPAGWWENLFQKIPVEPVPCIYLMVKMCVVVDPPVISYTLSGEEKEEPRDSFFRGFFRPHLRHLMLQRDTFECSKPLRQPERRWTYPGSQGPTATTDESDDTFGTSPSDHNSDLWPEDINLEEARELVDDVPWLILSIPTPAPWWLWEVFKGWMGGLRVMGQYRGFQPQIWWFRWYYPSFLQWRNSLGFVLFNGCGPYCKCRWE